MPKLHLEVPRSLGHVDAEVMREMHQSLDTTNRKNPTLTVKHGEVTFTNPTPVFRKFTNYILERIVSSPDVIDNARLIGVCPSRQIVHPDNVYAQVARNWHVDSCKKIGVSSVLPTEFLLGTLYVPLLSSEAVESFCKTPAFESQQDECEVYTPLPGELYVFDNLQVHRSAVNKTDEIVDRMFVEIIVS